MESIKKGQQWALHEYAQPVEASQGVKRRVMAYCDEMMCVENEFEKGAVGALHSHPHTQITYVAEGVFEFQIGEEKRIVKKGDTLLKQNGIEHGCICLEKGILVDIFTPMRDDFI